MLRAVFRSAGSAFRSALGTRAFASTKSPGKSLSLPLRYLLSENRRLGERAASNNLPRKTCSGTVLFAGLLGFLGRAEEREDAAESELVTTIKKAVLSMQKGHLDKAEDMLHVALKIARDEKNEDGIIYVHDTLANLMFDTGRNAKAEKLFLDVMHRLMSAGVDANDNRILHISLKLAKIYEKTRQYLKAESGYKYSAEHLREKVEVFNIRDKDTLQLWLTSLDNLARFLAGRKRPLEAMPYFKKAYELSLDLNGKEHEETALILNDMGATANMTGDVDSAVMYTEEAISIGKALGEEMDNLAVMYLNLANLYMMKDMYKEARAACLRGLGEAKRSDDQEMIAQGRECLQKIEKVYKDKNGKK